MIGRACAAGLAAIFVCSTAAAQPRWRLVEDLRIGGGDDGPTSFNDIRDVAVDKSGRVYVLDYQTQEIRLFGADGKFIRLLGRSGAGPGEFRQPNGIRLAPDGTLWVNDHRNARYTVFSSTGDFAKQVSVAPWGYGFRWDGTFDAQGRLMEAIPLRTNPADRSARVIRRYDPAAAKFDSLTIPSCFESGQYKDWSVTWKNGTMSGVSAIPFAPMAVSHITPTGTWLCALGDEYHVKLLRFNGGAPISEVKSTSSAVPISAAARDSAIKRFYAPPSNVPPGTLDESRIPTAYARIEEVDVDDEGRIWVRRRAAIGLAIDIWSFNGKLVATIDAPVYFEKYRPFIVRNGALYVVVTDADGVPAIVRYRIRANAG